MLPRRLSGSISGTTVCSSKMYDAEKFALLLESCADVFSGTRTWLGLDPCLEHTHLFDLTKLCTLFITFGSETYAFV